MKNVAVIGCSGAGKSTFAKKLSAITRLPLYHLDQIFWKPGWIQENPEVLNEKLNEWLKREEWIIDGNYSQSMPQRFEKSDTIFFFDLPVWLCMMRVFKRILTTRGRVRPDMAEDCPERFNLDFLIYVLNFRRVTRPKIIKFLEENAKHCHVVQFRTGSDADKWLKTYVPN